VNDVITKLEPVELVPANVRVPQAVSETVAYIAMLERAAMDPAFDLDRLERLIQLKDKALSDAARREFNAAMAAVQRELPQVVQNAENKQTKSWYATIDAIGEAIDPVITKHGFSQSFSSGRDAPAGHYRVICLTAHIGGHERTDELDVPIDIAGIAGTKNKTATHALKSTISYARVILTMMVFNVKSRKAMPDDDGNAAGGYVEDLPASVRAYLEIALGKIAEFETAAELTAWWQAEKEQRAAIDLVNTKDGPKPGYRQLFEAFSARGKELSK
jgi:hypothetical protein